MKYINCDWKIIKKQKYKELIEKNINEIKKIESLLEALFLTILRYIEIDKVK